MAPDLVAGVDSSTQSCTVMLRRLDDGAAVALARAPHPPVYPPKSEQDPQAWWDALLDCLRQLQPYLARIAAISVGLAQGCVDECVRYLGEREAFGRKLGESQFLQFKLADMDARTHVARLACHDAAHRLVAGRPFKREAAIAKLTASDVAMVLLLAGSLKRSSAVFLPLNLCDCSR